MSQWCPELLMVPGCVISVVTAATNVTISNATWSRSTCPCQTVTNVPYVTWHRRIERFYNIMFQSIEKDWFKQIYIKCNDLAYKNQNIYLTFLEVVDSLMTRSEDGNWGCLQCPYKSNRRFNVQCHVESKHLEMTGGYSCHICSEVLKNRKILMHHVAKHKKSVMWLMTNKLSSSSADRFFDFQNWGGNLDLLAV